MSRAIDRKVREAAHAALDRWLAEAEKAAPDGEMGEEASLRFVIAWYSSSGGFRRDPADDELDGYFGLTLKTSTIEHM